MEHAVGADQSHPGLSRTDHAWHVELTCINTCVHTQTDQWFWWSKGTWYNAEGKARLQLVLQRTRVSFGGGGAPVSTGIPPLHHSHDERPKWRVCRKIPSTQGDAGKQPNSRYLTTWTCQNLSANRVILGFRREASLASRTFVHRMVCSVCSSMAKHELSPPRRHCSGLRSSETPRHHISTSLKWHVP